MLDVVFLLGTVVVFVLMDVFARLMDRL